MKRQYYAASQKEGIIQIVTELGINELLISVGNNKLDWYQIRLNEEQTKGLIKFLKDNKVGEWEK